MTEAELIDAEELAREYSVTQLADTAEQYFAAIDDWSYHLAKPLGNVLEAPTILAHFAAMLSALRLEDGMSVLDFGAGSCWTSRMLVQLGCNVVACDVSPTALAMGARLFEVQPPLGSGTIQFLRFDGETIDLPDASVDRVSCMDAFHHVPNWSTVLAEFHRILRPGGRAVLAEGGPDHSRTPQSQMEMRNFTVLERDVVVEELAQLATSAGFGETTVGIYAGLPFLVPAERFATELQSGEVARAAVETFLDNHRLIALTKPGTAPFTSRRVDGLRADIAVEDLGGHRFRARVRNTGDSTWLGRNVAVGTVNLGVVLLAPGGAVLDLDYLRVGLSDSPAALLEPGEQVTIEFEVEPPEMSSYSLRFDLVSEGVGWLSTLTGVPPSLLGPFGP
ncbi:MAG: hypothetical protein JWM34_2312 [Ilumatobacteraceae bacterium]|nr:hypothetical protein [Ilumatobacteraceae bacterium]